MKHQLIILFTILCFAFYSHKVDAQSEEVQQLLLDVEKLTQLKQISKDMKSGYEIVSKGYNTIKNISEGNFNLHQSFLNSLWEVSPMVKDYKKVADIIRLQLQLVKEYKTTYRQFRQNGIFSPGEVQYIGNVYSNLLNESVKNLNALTAVLTPHQLRMSDDERLTAIDGIYATLQDQLSFLRYFNNTTSILALQLTKEKADIHAIKDSYGVTQ